MARHGHLTVLAISLAATVLVAACSSPATSPARPQADATAIAATARPAASPAATPSAKPFIPVGTFAVTPRSARMGATVTAAGTGLGANKTLELVWLGAEGSWRLSENRWQYRGREFAETRTPLTTVKTDAAGAFSAAFAIPAGFGFTHDVLVLDGETTVNKTAVEVQMEVTVSPSSGPAGTPITIEAKGIGYRDMQNSWLVSYDNKFTGWMSAVTTRGTAKAVIPAAGPVGAHVITILHGHMSWPYLNMQQSPQPDRPQFRVPFTVTEGPAVLPAAPETQSVADRFTAPARGSFWSEPTRGTVGSKATLHATGVTPNAEVEFGWVNVAGQDWVAGTRPDRVEILGKARADARGEVTFDYAVPDVQGGAHPVRLVSGGQVVATTSFLVVPSILPLTVARGPSGTEFQVRVTGMYATDTGKIVNLVYDNANVGYACSFNSGGNIQITFRATGEPGWHFIDLYPGILTGEETTPMNYRVPQLTGDVDHPGERMPIFHLAFEITAP